jgi:hypothetical protein
MTGEEIESDYSEFRVWLTPYQERSLEEQVKLRKIVLKYAKDLYDENPGYWREDANRSIGILRKKCAGLTDPHKIVYHCTRECFAMADGRWDSVLGSRGPLMSYYTTKGSPIRMRGTSLDVPEIGRLLCNRHHPTGREYYISLVKLIDVGGAVYARVCYRRKDTDRPQGMPPLPKRDGGDASENDPEDDK